MNTLFFKGWRLFLAAVSALSIISLLTIPTDKSFAACASVPVTGGGTPFSGTLNSTDCQIGAWDGGMTYYDEYTFSGYP
ncbi:MAG: hypothetical protein WC797_02850, partial [Candidatus Paceibacterota bacterium]